MSIYDDKTGENYLVQYLSDLTEDEAKRLLGKKITKVVAKEYSLTLTLDDESDLVCEGASYDRTALMVELNIKE